MIKNYYTKQQTLELLNITYPTLMGFRDKGLEYIKINNQYAYKKLSVIALANILERDGKLNPDWKIRQRHIDYQTQGWGDAKFTDYVTAKQVEHLLSRQRMAVLAKTRQIHSVTWDGLRLFDKIGVKRHLEQPQVVDGMLSKLGIDLPEYQKLLNEL